MLTHMDDIGGCYTTCRCASDAFVVGECFDFIEGTPFFERTVSSSPFTACPFFDRIPPVGVKLFVTFFPRGLNNHSHHLQRAAVRRVAWRRRAPRVLTVRPGRRRSRSCALEGRTDGPTAEEEEGEGFVIGSTSLWGPRRCACSG